MSYAYSGPYDVLKRVQEEEGFKAHFRGNMTNFLNFFPRYFSVQVLHPIIKDQINGFVGVNQMALDGAVAFFTGLSNIVLTHPLDVM